MPYILPPNPLYTVCDVDDVDVADGDVDVADVDEPDVDEPDGDVADGDVDVPDVTNVNTPDVHATPDVTNVNTPDAARCYKCKHTCVCPISSHPTPAKYCGGSFDTPSAQGVGSVLVPC